MKLIAILLAGAIAFAACGDTSTGSNDSTKDSTAGTNKAVVNDSMIATTPIPLDGCYKMITGHDTATLRLNVVDSLVSGQLSFHWAEKDRNDGTVKGVVRDSLVILNYTFRSEGMLSVRQVVFKLAGTALVEGHGDLNTGGDTVRFKDIDQLKYQMDRPFIKKPCIE